LRHGFLLSAKPRRGKIACGSIAYRFSQMRGFEQELRCRKLPVAVGKCPRGIAFITPAIDCRAGTFGDRLAFLS
jgi:hypothetical protein